MVCPYPESYLSKEHQYRGGDFLRSGLGLAACESAAVYIPRNPEGSVLYGVVASQLETFLERQDRRDRIVPLLAELYSASVSGRVATGPRAGSRVARVGAAAGFKGTALPSGQRCAAVAGFSIHAGVSVPAHDRVRLERLARYAGRPPLAGEQLWLLPDGGCFTASSAAGATELPT